jgi:hypothetical protein
MVQRYAESVASASTVLALCEKLRNVVQDDCSPNSGAALLSQEESWQASQHKFCEDLTIAGSLYPDIIQPVLYAANQVKNLNLTCFCILNFNGNIELNFLDEPWNVITE